MWCSLVVRRFFGIETLLFLTLRRQKAVECSRSATFRSQAWPVRRMLDNFPPNLLKLRAFNANCD
jgi:hypothetical protein